MAKPTFSYLLERQLVLGEKIITALKTVIFEVMHNNPFMLMLYKTMVIKAINCIDDRFNQAPVVLK